MEQAINSGSQLTGMRWQAVRLGWFVITSLVLVMFIVSVPVEYQTRFNEGLDQFAASLRAINVSAYFYAGFRTFLDISLALVFWIIGVIIFIRKSASGIVVLSSIATQTFGALFVPTFYFLGTAQPVWNLPVSFIRSLGLALCLIVFFFLIPDGRFVPRWTRWLAVAWGAIVLYWLIAPQAPANLVHMTTWSSSIGLAFAVYLAFFGSGLYSQIYRYRFVSNHTQRQQTKWFIVGIALGFTGFILYQLPIVLLPALFNAPTVYRIYQILFGIPVYHLFILMVPAFIAVSITRHRLWDIDHLINRALIASTLTIVLALFYAGSVILLSQLFALSTDRSQDSLVIGLSTLAIAILFNPLRRKTQDIIDRRFYKQRYNTEKTLSALSVSLREEVDLQVLESRLVALIQQTLQPDFVALRLTSMPAIPSSPSKPVIQADDPIIAYFLAHPAITDVNQVNLSSPALAELRAQGTALIAPLVAQGHLTGLIGLGRRLSEQDYSVDDRHLLTILSSQAAPALRVAQLVRQQQEEMAERQQVEYEMNVARQIQLGFLPGHTPDLPGWQIAVHYQPARAVGGDFYDFQPLPDGRLAIIIGDVSGHGVPSALLMVKISSVIRDLVLKLKSPATILQQANQQLHSDMPPSMFATCLFAILDPRQGELIFANAGHNIPMRSAKGQVEDLWASGLPLGLMEKASYENRTAKISTGDFLVFTSDGLVEARNPAGEIFGDARVKSVLQRNNSDAKKLSDVLVNAIFSHMGDSESQEDDMTIVIFHRV